MSLKGFQKMGNSPKTDVLPIKENEWVVGPREGLVLYSGKSTLKLGNAASRSPLSPSPSRGPGLSLHRVRGSCRLN